MPETIATQWLLAFLYSMPYVTCQIQTEQNQGKKMWAVEFKLQCVKKLLSIYESFQLGHVYFTNAEFDSAIQKIIQVSNEIQISYLLESIEQETLKRK